jgi:hypothetical protein
MPLDPTRLPAPLPRLAADPLSRVVVALMLLAMSPTGPRESREAERVDARGQRWAAPAPRDTTPSLFPLGQP